MFAEPLECQDFVVRLGRVSGSWTIYAGCLMGTHYHLVFRPLDANASDRMRDLHGGFARAFNRRHGRRGAVWESRFTSTWIEDDAHLTEVIRYVAHNPVRANLAVRPQDWPWSTYGQVIGTQRRWPFFDPLRTIELFENLAALRA